MKSAPSAEITTRTFVTLGCVPRVPGLSDEHYLTLLRHEYEKMELQVNHIRPYSGDPCAEQLFIVQVTTTTVLGERFMHHVNVANLTSRAVLLGKLGAREASR